MPKALDDAAKQNKTFVQEVRRLAEMYPSNEEIQAVAKFYDNPDNLQRIKWTLYGKNVSKRRDKHLL